MVRGRKKTSVAEKKKSNPKTYRADKNGCESAKVGGDPVKPKDLTGEALVFWDTYVPILIEAGIAESVDTPELTAMCEWWAEYREHVVVERDRLLGIVSLCDSINQLAIAISKTPEGFNFQAAEAVIESIASDIRKADSVSARRDRATARRQAYELFSRTAAKFGLTKLDRQKITETGEPKAESAMDAFFKRREAASNATQS